MSYIAELRNVTRNFTGITALDEVNLQVMQGEVLALLGPNGSGKSTLLRILASIDTPSDGEVYFRNTKVTDRNIAQFRKESTMVFQKTTLFNTTVYNNVAYGLKLRKISKRQIDEKVARVLALVRLNDSQQRHAKRLSGGEQQRVALARALVLETELLLLDEPTANLDPRNASIIEEAITTINRQQRTTVVMATHNMFQAKNLPMRIALMENGKISEIGSPADIFRKLSKTLASFAAVENTFAGEARVVEDGTTVVDVGNDVRIVAVAPRTGKISVFISPDDIILSKTSITSSARNSLEGNIAEILDLDSVVRLRVDAGKSFTVQITRRSFQEMGLNLGSHVFLAFKASSVQIL